MDLDTLNVPAGKLVGAFLLCCPDLDETPEPFAPTNALTLMRNQIVGASGRAGVVGRHRLIEALAYFLRADPDWTEESLVEPLMEDSPESIALWRAVGRRTRYASTLGFLGDAMVARATDARIDKSTRRSLAFSLVVESLHAFNDQRESAIALERVQQMLRAVDDEVRAHAAHTVVQFLKEISSAADETLHPEQVFGRAVAPFLAQVWPQEKSLVTPGVSNAFAELPANARNEFAKAVAAIERFVVPFSCWSLMDFGLFDSDGEQPQLSDLESSEKATALLRLLDLSVGDQEGAVVPHDLASALEHIEKVDPSLMQQPSGRRLATLARRR